jgi:hypothetical protein
MSSELNALVDVETAVEDKVASVELLFVEVDDNELKAEEPLNMVLVVLPARDDDDDVTDELVLAGVSTDEDAGDGAEAT